jgi:hypothetical protein
MRSFLRVPSPCRRHEPDPTACCLSLLGGVGTRAAAAPTTMTFWSASAAGSTVHHLDPLPPPACAARPSAATGGGPMPRGRRRPSAPEATARPRSLLPPLLLGVRFVVRRMRPAAAALEPAVIDSGRYRRRPIRRREQWQPRRRGLNFNFQPTLSLFRLQYERFYHLENNIIVICESRTLAYGPPPFNQPLA